VSWVSGAGRATTLRAGLLGSGELFPMNQCVVYNIELIQLFGDLDIFSFVRISRLNWIGHVNILRPSGFFTYHQV
jgi:hypothetical protein